MIVTLPALIVLPVVSVFSVTVTVTIPFPVPDEGEYVIHVLSSVTVQDALDVTVIVLLPAAAVKLNASGETERLHVGS